MTVQGSIRGESRCFVVDGYGDFEGIAYFLLVFWI